MQFAWDDLRLFIAIARAGSLAGAARRLGVNHSTVFRRLNALEAGLEVRLFERLPEGYVLTGAGEALRVRAERVEEEAQAIERELSGQDVRLAGRVRLTTTDSIANSFLSDVLSGFCAAYPGIELDLVISGANLDLGRREADMAIRPTPAPPENLIGRKLGVIRWGLYGSRAYLAAREPLKDLQAPGAHRFVGGNELIGHIASTRWLDARVPREAFAMRTNSIVCALGAARAGAGLAVLPHYLARTEPELACVMPIGEEVATGMWLLTHPDLRHSARVRAFMDYTVEALKHRRGELEGEA